MRLGFFKTTNANTNHYETNWNYCVQLVDCICTYADCLWCWIYYYCCGFNVRRLMI